MRSKCTYTHPNPNAPDREPTQLSSIYTLHAVIAVAPCTEIQIPSEETTNTSALFLSVHQTTKPKHTTTDPPRRRRRRRRRHIASSSTSSSSSSSSSLFRCVDRTVDQHCVHNNRCCTANKTHSQQRSRSLRWRPPSPAPSGLWLWRGSAPSAFNQFGRPPGWPNRARPSTAATLAPAEHVNPE